ncbi:MAG TPA: FmdE family protein [Noviherbaspirillum sp.]|uniref:FmdE family protein n=1 Tax=Noviherbaspirillum sp. TaxID=1926288 RepID=UPI002D559EC0|nr:FmdE family protein [Noviherbaspirillum sp.]HYD94560.1 FmdE family protein [Noviherbaspirillum sp.]
MSDGRETTPDRSRKTEAAKIMDYPAFFDDAPVIAVHDGLARFLGACSDGIIRYRYLDAVKLAGHSCPTVAGAYLMTRRALALLYPDDMPERGEVSVRFSAAADEGVAGVIGSVVGMVTGAAGPGGFKGISGHFRRQHLMHYSDAAAGEACFERRDNGESVQLALNLHRVPADPRTGALLRKILDGGATPEDAAEFAGLWQDRVRRILIEHADDPDLYSVA